MSTERSVHDITDELLDRKDGTVLRIRDQRSVWVLGTDRIVPVGRRLTCVWSPDGHAVGQSHSSADLQLLRVRTDTWEVIGHVPGTPAATTGDDRLYRAYKKGLTTS